MHGVRHWSRNMQYLNMHTQDDKEEEISESRRRRRRLRYIWIITQ